LFLITLVATKYGALPLDQSAWLFWREVPESETLAVGSRHILWGIRLPRILFAGVVGASLGIGGALTQALFRNPLAEPGLLGISSGAACAAALSIVFLARIPGADTFASHWLPLPLIAFSGAILVCLFLNGISQKWMTGSMGGLLLTGIAVNALAGAVIGLCAYTATDIQLRTLTFWTLGSLANVSWTLVAVSSGILLVTWIAARPLLQGLNALLLGENIARHVGVCLPSLRLRIVLIGFVGLVAPHLVRMTAGADLRVVLPRAAIVGAILLICADTLARTIAAPAEVPVGIFTALLGSSFFLWLLARDKGRAV
jgi:iron complex transport system permease protein